jgi:hypothetical protein
MMKLGDLFLKFFVVEINLGIPKLEFENEGYSETKFLISNSQFLNNF